MVYIVHSSRQIWYYYKEDYLELWL